jgi:putative glycosyltransferase
MYTLSIITSIYKSSDHIVRFIEEAKKVIDELNIKDFEFIIVNDGCPENSGEIIKKKFINRNYNIKLVELSRNFGHHNALLEGLKYCKKELTFLIDCDLEIHPNSLKILLNKINENDYDCAYGISSHKFNSQRNNFLKIFLSKLSNLFFKKFYKKKYNSNQLHVRLMKKKYVESILSCNDFEPVLIDLYDFVGFKQIYVEVDYLRRNKSSYTFSKRFKLFLNFILSNSEKVLVVYYFISLFSLVTSSILALIFFINNIFFDTFPGFTTTVIINIIYGNLIILGTAICSLYLNKIYVETKRRPRSIVKKIEDL